MNKNVIVTEETLVAPVVVDAAASKIPVKPAFAVLGAVSFSHFLNDMMQSLVPALYPMLKGDYGLSFAQIGMITLVSQLISSILQPRFS